MYSITVTYQLKNEEHAREAIPACVEIGEQVEITDGTNTYAIVKQQEEKQND